MVVTRPAPLRFGAGIATLLIIADSPHGTAPTQPILETWRALCSCAAAASSCEAVWPWLGLGLLSGCGGLPFRAQQSARVPRIGVIWSAPQPFYEAFRTGLHDLGYVEGQNVVLEYRDAEGKAELIPDLTAELIRLQVDVIVAAPAVVARGARQVTETLPIVVAYGDPVTQGLVVSLAWPGGNVTGLTAATAELSGKRLQLLQEALPGIRGWPSSGRREAEARARS